MNQFTEYVSLIRSKLTDKRFLHSLNVADAARKLALLNGYDEDSAYLAGLLHDAMKDTHLPEQLQMIRDAGIDLSETEGNEPRLWHAVSGAALVQKELGLSQEIVSAIRYHTTGRPDMTLLEKILYVADYISPERDESVNEIRRLAEISLDQAVFEGLRYGIGYLSEKKRIIEPRTVEAYDQYVYEFMTGDQRPAEQGGYV